MNIRWRAGLAMAAALLFLASSSFVAARAVSATDEAEVRSRLEQAFQQLRAGDYNALYEALPSSSQRRIPRERFVTALERTRGMYELDRLQIGAMRVSGNLAAVDTVVYGRVRQPVATEGKIVVRQYLMREDGQWRVATADRSTIRRLLAGNPTLARRFPPSEPRIYIKRDGRWMDIGSLSAARRHMQQ